MSSTCTPFQAPAYTYGHQEREPQQPYFEYELSSYSADSRAVSENAVPIPF